MRFCVLILAIPSAYPATPLVSKPTLVAARPNGRRIAAKPTPAATTADPASAARALQATAGAFVLGLALVALTPTTHIIDAHGAEHGMRLLTALSTASAAAEIGLSPLVGSLADAIGRKKILLGAVLSALLTNGAVAIAPSVGLLAMAKFVSPLAVGLYFLASGATLADCLQGQPAQLAAASGVLFAVISGGFGFGVGLSGFLPPGLRARYALSTCCLAASLCCAVVLVPESLPASSRIAFRPRSANPLSCVRLFRSGRRMRVLAVLALLHSAPMFMGDTLQVYLLKQWKLSDAEVTQLYTVVAATGLAANSVAGIIIERMGLIAFSTIATVSIFLCWVGATVSRRAFVACAIIGFLGQARTLGTNSMMTAEGARAGMPLGQLAGDRANLTAWLKIFGPILYGQLYLGGLRIGIPQLPFYLNLGLAAAALAILPTLVTGV